MHSRLLKTRGECFKCHPSFCDCVVTKFLIFGEQVSDTSHSLSKFKIKKKETFVYFYLKGKVIWLKTKVAEGIVKQCTKFHLIDVKSLLVHFVIQELNVDMAFFIVVRI